MISSSLRLAVGLIRKIDFSLCSATDARFYRTAFIFALLTASTASSVYYSLRQNYPSKGTLDTVFVHLPFSLFHSYSIVLVLISAFALFTTGLKTPESHHPGFTVKLLVLIAEGFLAVTALGYAFSKREGDLAGAFVMAWFLYGIYDRKSSISSSLFWVSTKLTLLSLAADQVNHTIKYFALGASIVASFAVLKVRNQPLCPSSFHSSSTHHHARRLSGSPSRRRAERSSMRNELLSSVRRNLDDSRHFRFLFFRWDGMGYLGVVGAHTIILMHYESV